MNPILAWFAWPKLISWSLYLLLYEYKLTLVLNTYKLAQVSIHFRQPKPFSVSLSAILLSLPPQIESPFNKVHKGEGNTRAAPPLPCLVSNLAPEIFFEWINKIIRRTLKLIGRKEVQQQHRLDGFSWSAHLCKRIIWFVRQRVAVREIHR